MLRTGLAASFSPLIRRRYSRRVRLGAPARSGTPCAAHEGRRPAELAHQLVSRTHHLLGETVPMAPPVRLDSPTMRKRLSNPSWLRSRDSAYRSNTIKCVRCKAVLAGAGPHARSTYYPCWRQGLQHPMQHAPELQAVVPTFNRRRPISQDGKGFALPRTVPGAGTSKHAMIESCEQTPFDKSSVQLHAPRPRPALSCAPAGITPSCT
jgi:hypothetical protein